MIDQVHQLWGNLFTKWSASLHFALQLFSPQELTVVDPREMCGKGRHSLEGDWVSHPSITFKGTNQTCLTDSWLSLGVRGHASPSHVFCTIFMFFISCQSTIQFWLNRHYCSTRTNLFSSSQFLTFSVAFSVFSSFARAARSSHFLPSRHLMRKGSWLVTEFPDMFWIHAKLKTLRCFKDGDPAAVQLSHFLRPKIFQHSVQQKVYFCSGLRAGWRDWHDHF